MISSKDRYTRQTSLEQFGDIGQAKLASARVLIVGLGGLGIPVAQYLNAMGVGTLGLVEQDVVELHNLQRQVLYTEKDLGQPKLQVGLERLRGQNSRTELVGFSTFLTPENALEICQDFDIVVDASDNFPTRYLINDACVILNKPFVYGALHGFEGQVSVFNYQDGPTYRCLFPKQPQPSEIPNCNENGVLGVIPGIIGNLQALEAVKVVTGIGQVLSGKLLIYDGLSQKNQLIQFNSNPENMLITELLDSYGTLDCSSITSITTMDYLELPPGRQLIDIRTKEEFAKKHLDGAINIPLQDLNTSLHQINFAVPVYLICQSGKRSEAAWQALRTAYPKAAIYNIQGGMNKIALLCH